MSDGLFILLTHLFNLYCSMILFFDKKYKWPKTAVGIFYLSITALLNWYFINCLSNYTAEYLRIAGFIGLCISLILRYLSQFKIVIEKMPIDEEQKII